MKDKVSKEIAGEKLQDLLTSQAQVTVIDSLPEGHFKQKHLPGAVNACVFEVSFVDQVAELVPSKDQPLVVYGASGQTYDARTAAEKLLRAGYSDVAILTGGLKAWQAAGGPLEGNAEEEVGPLAVGLTDGAYQVDTSASVIEWSGRNPNSTHRGTLKLAGGEVNINAGQISGSFTIDMTSIENVNLAGDDLKPVLEAHLLSDDFFFVKRFPQAKFKMSAQPTANVLPVSSPNYLVSGCLTLCGVNAEQEFSATIVPSDEGQIVAEAHFDIDRTRWGVIYGSSRFFEYLGMHLVFDQISLQLRILTK